MTDDAFSFQPKNNSKIGFILGPLAILIIVGLGYVVSNEATKKVYRDFKPTGSEMSSSITPTNVPQVSINPKEFTISVLNGSGISGQAGEFKTMLEKDGYVVKSVGNGDKDDYAKVRISAKQNVPQVFLDALKKSIVSLYDVEEIIDPIEQNTETDIEIITAPQK